MRPRAAAAAAEDAYLEAQEAGDHRRKLRRRPPFF